MKLSVLSILVASCLCAQVAYLPMRTLMEAPPPSGGTKTAYLQTTPFPSIPIDTVSNTTPVVITGRDNLTGFSVGQLVYVGGVCAGSTGASTANTIRRIKAVNVGGNPKQASLMDLSSVDIPAGGAACSPGTQQASWIAPVTAVTIPAGDGFDGLNGPVQRRFVLSTDNGLSSLVVSGSTLTVTTSFDPTTQPIPVTVGRKFSVWGTTSSALNKPGGTAGNPYTVTSVSSTGWTATVSGVSAATYTTNMNCGPQSIPDGTRGTSENCVVISQDAWNGNPGWDFMTNRFYGYVTSGVSYKSYFDGGSSNNQPGFDEGENTVWAAIAEIFMVDRLSSCCTADNLLNAGVYFLNHIERGYGVNWVINTATREVKGSQYDYAQWAAFGILHAAYYRYLSTSDQAKWMEKLWANTDVPGTTCSSANADLNTSGHNEVVGSGTATASSSTSLTLNSSPSADPSNNEIQALNGSGDQTWGLITAWNSGTKVATISGGWSNGTAASTSPYSIYATITWGSGAFATGTVTGINTHFSTFLAAGYAVMASNGFGSAEDTQATQLFINSVTNDTHASGTSVQAPSASSTPAMVWYFKPWQNGDCGFRWHEGFWGGSFTANPLLYPTGGGSQVYNQGGDQPSLANNNNSSNTHMLGDFWFLGTGDQRVVNDLAQQETLAWNYQISTYMNYKGGEGHNGSAYNYYTAGWFPQTAASTLQLGTTGSSPTFPDLKLTGPWVAEYSRWKIQNLFSYAAARTGPSRHTGHPSNTGSGGSYSNVYDSPSTFIGLMLNDPILLWAPTSPYSKQLKSWSFHGPLSGFNPWTYVGNQPDMVLVDQSIDGDSDIYYNYPFQYEFHQTNYSDCVSIFGAGSCQGQNFRGDQVYSTTGWIGISQSGSFAQTWLNASFRGYLNGHDLHEGGMVRVAKANEEMLFPDSNPPGTTNNDSADWTVNGDVTAVGPNGANLHDGDCGDNPGCAINPSMSKIIGYWSQNHGSFATEYGDANSNAMLVVGDNTGSFKSAAGVNNAIVAVLHAKKPTRDEFIVRSDKVSLSTPNSITNHIHYTQNLETNVSFFAEGDTTCPGSGGCGSLNTTRWIQSLQSGASPGGGDPPLTYGISTKILTAGTVAWDGSGYPGAFGHTDRVSICAGTCGDTSQTSFRQFTFHKVMSTLSDTTQTDPVALNPDANFTGGYSCGAVSCVVFIQNKDFVNHSSIGPFTTSFTGSSGTGMYAIYGLTAGSYDITVNSVEVAGSPFTVPDGDNSVVFEAVNGAISVNGAAPASNATTIRGNATLPGAVVIK